MVRELNHVGIQVADADRSVRFYTELLGGRIASEAMIPATNTKCIYLQIANGLVEFLCRGDGTPPPKMGLTHVAFLVENLDAAYLSLTMAGFEFSVKPKVAGSGRGRVAFLSDPNGVRIELIERDDSFRIPRINTGTIKSFDHISLVADKLEPAVRFYIDRLELKLLKRMRVESRELDMVYLNHGEDVVELLHRPTAQNGAELIGHLSFRVDSVDETAEYLRGRGVVIEAGSPKPAGTGIGRVCVFRDPDDVKIELVDRKDLREL
jgi:catechol 2,3-dioxygenase-like lactoylglutathione lyase family enzyme